MNRRASVAVGVAVGVALAGCATFTVARTSEDVPIAAGSSAPSQSATGGVGSASPVPRPAKPSRPSAGLDVPTSWWPRRSGKTIYLTFDDGPWPTTNQVLDVLRDNDARATFFQIGQQVDNYGSITQRIIAEGHAVGNHTYDHVYMSKLPPDQVKYQLLKTWRTIGYDVQGPCVRPPYGAATAVERKIAVDLGMTPVFWNIDTLDWSGSERQIYDQIVSARPGSIVLMHDGGGERSKTVAALRKALPVLKKRGYVFEPVPVCVNR